MITFWKISGAAILAAGVLAAQAPSSDPGQSTLPGSTPSSMQDRNNAAPGSMQRSTTTGRMSTPGSGASWSGYLVDAACSGWQSAGMPRRSTPSGDMVNRSSPRDTTTSAMSPSGDVTSAQMSPRDPTTSAMTQRQSTPGARGGMRTDTRTSATEMANSENMIEDQVSATGKRRSSETAAGTQSAMNKPPTACSASLSTTEFGIFSNGKLYYFDAASNSNFQHQYSSNEKMKMALSNGTTAPVMVTASGMAMGDTIHVMKIHRGAQ